jgi:hypothetical protein
MPGEETPPTSPENVVSGNVFLAVVTRQRNEKVSPEGSITIWLLCDTTVVGRMAIRTQAVQPHSRRRDRKTGLPFH